MISIFVFGMKIDFYYWVILEKTSKISKKRKQILLKIDNLIFKKSKKKLKICQQKTKKTNILF